MGRATCGSTFDFDDTGHCFDVPRDDLANLEAVWFVRSAFDADDLWGLVWHCRNSRPGHGRFTAGSAAGVYDLAIGPVAANWRQRAAFYDADQVSFHTLAAAAVLNNSSKSATTIAI